MDEQLDEQQIDQARSRAKKSTRGLAIGDGFGQRMFGEAPDEDHQLPSGTWHYTDDTAMALGIMEVLEEEGTIESDRLAAVFANRYDAEPNRGYGPGAHQILGAVVEGADCEVEAESVFDEEGSFGNGGAMRAAPVGAYFADDLEVVAVEAAASARVTHAHPQGIAGAVAVAIAAASMWQHRDRPTEIAASRIFEDVLRFTREGEVRDGILRARGYDADASAVEVAADLGCGEAVTAMDTVPYVIWCATAFMDDFEEAMWETVTPGGDRDTTCAMVGGIVAMRADLPDRWLEHVEPLDW